MRCAATPTRTVSRSLSVSTTRLVKPTKKSQTSTSGTVTAGRSVLKPADEVWAGAYSTSAVIEWRVDGCRSKRPKVVTPVVPMFGRPDWPVTPGTGTRS